MFQLSVVLLAFENPFGMVQAAFTTQGIKSMVAVCFMTEVARNLWLPMTRKWLVVITKGSGSSASFLFATFTQCNLFLGRWTEFTVTNRSERIIYFIFHNEKFTCFHAFTFKFENNLKFSMRSFFLNLVAGLYKK